jgi:hypothetical protein
MDENSLVIIPSEYDILNDIDRFSTDKNNNNPSQSTKLTDNSDLKNIKNSKNPNETVLTQETVKIFSTMPKNLPFK